MRHSLVLRLGWPNYDALVDKGRIGGLRTKAVLEAIEMERTMRASGTRGRLELPYDDEQKIVIEKDYGCIVESAEDALENAD
ncbi:MAG: hypothetical protein M5R36_04295 [Deltaproteobacteria bacterium]|nr:hypothetical protein [Deltaproteobacteria bacterium]